MLTTAILVSGTMFVVRASGHVEMVEGESGFIAANGGDILASIDRVGRLPAVERERLQVTGDSETARLRLRRHKIREGENLWMIARQYGVDINTITGCNQGLSDEGMLQAGREIIVPNQKGVIYRFKFGQTISDLSAAYNVRLDAIFRANGIANPKDVKAGDAIFIPGADPLAPNGKRQKMLESSIIETRLLPPMRGRLTARFGWRMHPIRKRREFHKGIDIAAYWGSRVKASLDGKVVYADWKVGYGYFIVLEHRFNYRTCYGHLTSPLPVKVGGHVKQGDVIGRTGTTGTSTGSHLHFEVRKEGRAVNPFRYIRW